MRINRLDLTRYGIFSDYSVEFRKPEDGTPDLHIVYGLNETGKSTALAAFLDLLFGIEPRSPYNFLHSYRTMRIGGILEIGGLAREFSRIKRTGTSLLDGNYNEIPDNVILGELGGIDRTSYTTMFSLDDDTLEKGGESILASEGDLGQLLFSASSGLSDIGRTLADLKAKAGMFYKYRARSGKLSELKTHLAKLKRQREDIDTVASEYKKLLATRDQAAERYNEAIAERGRIQARVEKLDGQLRALPKLAQLRKIRESLEPLSEIPEAPLGWSNELPNMKDEEIRLEADTENIEREIKNISDELKDIVFDESVLSFADSVNLLKDLYARYVTADKDLPDRRLQHKEVDLSISGILRRIECEEASDPGDLLLPASTVSALRNLMEKRSGVDTAVKTAEEELDEANRRLNRAQDDLRAAVGDTEQTENEVPGSTSSLESALLRARDGDHDVRYRLAKQSRTDHLDTFAERMVPLHPWKGEAEELEGMSIPDADNINVWKDSMERVRRRLERNKENIGKLVADQRRLKAEIEAIGRVVGAAGDHGATEVRAVREETWANHKRILNAESARIFEDALRHDDIVTGSRISHAAEIAKLNESNRALAATEADIETEHRGRDTAAGELSAVLDKVSAAVRAMTPSLPEDMSLSRLERWLAERGKALESLSEAKNADREVKVAEEDGERIRTKLIEALRTIGVDSEPDVSIDTLTSLAQEIIDKKTELETLRSGVRECRSEVDIRTCKVDKEKEAEKNWNQHWAELCAGCWLGEDGSIPAIPEVREILKTLDELPPLLEKHTSLANRIKKMEDDQREFSTEVGSLAKELSADNMLPPLELYARLKSTVDEAVSAQKKHGETLSRLREAEKRQQGIDEKREIHNRRKTEMLEYFSVDSLSNVDAKLRGIGKRDDLKKQEATVQGEILELLGVQSIGVAEDLLNSLDRDAVNEEIAELKGHFNNQDQLTRELFSEQKQAEKQVEDIEGDGTVAKIQEKRKLAMLEIEDGAVRYLRLRLGITAAERALQLYRDRHRSSMMTRASDAFRMISRGTYKELKTQPEGDSEVLIAVGANGGSKIVSALSKGTRFQLYLALRVAGYHEFVQSRQPVPFIADDIMETFDDFRAEEAFRLFAEMAETGQVIYLTHHWHLCEIARKTCPEVQVHELAPDN